MKNKTVRLFAERHLENFESMLNDIYKNEIFTDVTIHCKDGSVKAHRLVLASCSPYFRKVFVEHTEQNAVFLMHGFSYVQMQNLLEVIYKGCIDVPSDLLNSVYEIAEELEVHGITSSTESEKINGHGRDTRFKGQKRVAVDFKEAIDIEETPVKISKIPGERSSMVSNSDKSPLKHSIDNQLELEKDIKPDISKLMIPQRHDSCSTISPKKPTLWSLKQRKYKCAICPSSFKRASHLTRHQLVHTGERPYSCNQCEKAFSRHDKLKHHVRKAHMLLNELNDDLPPDSPYTIGHVQILSSPNSINEMEESSNIIRREDLIPAPRLSLPPQPVAPAPPKPSSLVRMSFPVSPTKKGRGRPRKYPPVPPPLIKRPRGRPRLNPLANSPFFSSTQASKHPSENYDITNMPYGDIEYLTKSYQAEMHENSSEPIGHLMEPLVEIKMEPIEKDNEENSNIMDCSSGASFLQNIGLLENSAIGKIGECIISVSNNSSV